MPSWYKKKHGSFQWNNCNKNKSQQHNKLFEDSECQKQCEDLKQYFLRGWKIPFYKNKTIPYHLRHFIKHINSKNSLFLTPPDAYEILTSHQKPSNEI